MCRQFGRLYLHQVRFNVFHDPTARGRRQKTDNRGMDSGGSSERPAVFAIAIDDFHDFIGELPVDAAVGFGFQFTFSNGRAVVLAHAIAHRKSSGKVS